MTKTALAQLVADTLQKTDADSIVLIKSFIDRRYDMIWNSGLWRESLGTTSYSVAAEDEDITLNSTVDFPVAASWDNDGIYPVDYGTVFQIEPDEFNQSGTPTAFIVLPKDSSGNAVVKLIRKPNVAKTLLVLGKLKITALGDTDSPKINGVDNAIVSWVTSDMLKHLRQYGKAQVEASAAAAYLAQVRDLEVGQAAKETRIIPQVANDWSVSDFT